VSLDFDRIVGFLGDTTKKQCLGIKVMCDMQLRKLKAAPSPKAYRSNDLSVGTINTRALQRFIESVDGTSKRKLKILRIIHATACHNAGVPCTVEKHENKPLGSIR
jgi:hypothetical protein